MMHHQELGFSSKDLCIRPRSGPSTRAGTPLYPQKAMAAPDFDLAASEERKAVDRVEQQLRDALFARTTAHVAEQRILKVRHLELEPRSTQVRPVC